MQDHPTKRDYATDGGIARRKKKESERKREKRSKEETIKIKKGREKEIARTSTGGGGGAAYLCLSFTSTLCIQTSCALTRPCGLDSISRNELRGRYLAALVVEETTRRCATRRRVSRRAVHPRQAQSCHPTTRRNWIFSRCFENRASNGVYVSSTFIYVIGNRFVFILNRAFRKRRYFARRKSAK